MNILKIICLLLFIFSNQLQAQKIFSEGVIKYDVFVNSSPKPDGVFIVTVKNGFAKRETAMNSGYNNIIIYNHKTGTTTSLNIDEESKYALELNSSEVQIKNKRFENAIITPMNDKKKLAGYQSQASKIIYTNGDEASFFYTNEILPPNDSFNMMFPGLKGIPLEYEIKSNANTIIRFIASDVSIKSIDQREFEIPKDYKIISKDELEKIR